MRRWRFVLYSLSYLTFPYTYTWFLCVPVTYGKIHVYAYYIYVHVNEQNVWVYNKRTMSFLLSFQARSVSVRFRGICCLFSSVMNDLPTAARPIDALVGKSQCVCVRIYALTGRATSAGRPRASGRYRHLLRLPTDSHHRRTLVVCCVLRRGFFLPTYSQVKTH